MTNYKSLFVIVVMILLLFYVGNLANNNSISMGSFQQITLLVAIVLLSFIFIFITVNLVYADKDVTETDIVPQCPDYWEIEETPTGPKCVNVQNLGVCAAASGTDHLTIDFNSGNFADSCAKYTWANNCNIAWDGLTYGANNPCDKA